MEARYFLNRMYPARIPAKSTWQRALKEAMEELPRVTMPFIDFDTGRGQIIAPVLIQAVPNTLDDNIDFIVRLPSGNDSGPTPSENLHMYGAMRKQAYYALLNLGLLTGGSRAERGYLSIPTASGTGFSHTRWNDTSPSQMTM